jgi:hypothetical protein
MAEGYPESFLRISSPLLFVAESEQVIQAGLSAVMAGLDSTIYSWRMGHVSECARNLADRNLKRMLQNWSELFISYYVVNMTAAFHYRDFSQSPRRKPEFEVLDYRSEILAMASFRKVWERWEWLNRSVGFDKLGSDEVREILERTTDRPEGSLRQSMSTGDRASQKKDNSPIPRNVQEMIAKHAACAAIDLTRFLQERDGVKVTES